MKIVIYVCMAFSVLSFAGSGTGLGGGVQLFRRVPLMDAGDVFFSSFMIEPYVSYRLNPQARIDLAFGYTSYDREPVNTGLYSTGEEVSGSDKSLSILAHAGAGSIKATFGVSNVWRNHEESYTVYGSIPYEVDYGEKKTSFMGIAGILFNPVRYASIATQLRYHSSSDFWVCLGVGFEY